MIVSKVDRLARNIKDGITIYEDLKRKVFFDDIFYNDIFMIGTRLIMAKQERELIRERTKKALNELKAKGIKLGRHKKVTKAEIKARNKDMINGQRLKSESYYGKQIIKHIIDYLKYGYSLYMIAKKLNELNFKTIYGNNFNYSTIKYLINQYDCFKESCDWKHI